MTQTPEIYLDIILNLYNFQFIECNICLGIDFSDFVSIIFYCFAIQENVMMYNLEEKHYYNKSHFSI